jgi:Glycoside hydrolase family 44
MNFPPASLQAELKLPVARWGGNATTRYNYLLDTSNRASDWYFEDIPNSVADPSALPGGSSADQFIEQNRAGQSATVRFYDLDNEPDIWFATHRDVHSRGAGYDEMLAKTESIAGAIKEADPRAQTLGPVGWGWSSLFYSGLDQQTCALQPCGAVPPDEAAHGGVPFAAWYLQQLAAYQKKTGVRLLNYFDNHWYPQEPGVTSEADDPATQALRLRSTRMLWDPTYTDESWINQPVMAIPRMKQLVAQNYPGTKVAISEYNWGALDKIDGGLAEADVLGIFGREGLNLATLWGPPNPTDPGAFAFRMYLDYDGQGSAFGNTSVSATSADQGQLSVYAAQRGRGHALTIMVINKTTGDLASPLSVTGLAPSASAQVYQYGQAGPTAIAHQPDQQFSHGQATVTFPAYSITEFVIPAAGLAHHAAHLPPATAHPAAGLTGTGQAVAMPAVPATRGGPAGAFLHAVGYRGRRVADGWNPRAMPRAR